MAPLPWLVWRPPATAPRWTPDLSSWGDHAARYKAIAWSPCRKQACQPFALVMARIYWCYSYDTSLGLAENRNRANNGSTVIAQDRPRDHNSSQDAKFAAMFLGFKGICWTKKLMLYYPLLIYSLARLNAQQTLRYQKQKSLTLIACAASLSYK